MADNSKAYAALDAIAMKLRKIEGLAEDSAKDVGKAFEEQIRNNVTAQLDPYGHRWRPSKDGYPLLVNAASAVKVEVNGTEIKINLEGPEVRHHVGSARGYHGGSSKRGGFRRPIIPFSKLPGPFNAIIRRVLQEHHAKIIKEAA